MSSITSVTNATYTSTTKNSSQVTVSSSLLQYLSDTKTNSEELVNDIRKLYKQAKEIVSASSSQIQV